MEKAREHSLGDCAECKQPLVNTYVFDMGTEKQSEKQSENRLRKFHLMCFLRKINLRVRI